MVATSIRHRTFVGSTSKKAYAILMTALSAIAVLMKKSFGMVRVRTVSVGEKMTMMIDLHAERETIHNLVVIVAATLLSWGAGEAADWTADKV